MNQLDLELPQVHMRPIGPVELPAAQPTTPPALSAPLRNQLIQVLRAIEAAAPPLEVAHSLLHEATQDPTAAGLEAVQRYREAATEHLHAAMAAAGYIRRLLSGDRSPAVWNGLQRQVEQVGATYAAVQSTFDRVMANADARANPTFQTLGQVRTVIDQAHGRVMAAIRPLLPAETR